MSSETDRAVVIMVPEFVSASTPSAPATPIDAVLASDDTSAIAAPASAKLIAMVSVLVAADDDVDTIDVLVTVSLPSPAFIPMA